MEMETSDDEAEDGQITKFEQEEEKERKLLGMTVANDEPMTIADLNKVRLTRDALAKHFLAPWFEDCVKGTASTVFFLPSLNGSRQERMCVTLWERKNIVSMRSIVREPIAHHLYPLTPL
jgi:RNA polymerase-associated protein RTF1